VRGCGAESDAAVRSITRLYPGGVLWAERRLMISTEGCDDGDIVLAARWLLGSVTLGLAEFA
jgi:hypothetical protein